MKSKLTLIFLSLILTNHIFGQVTTSPEFPIPDQNVTIYYDATQGNQELMGYNGDIYAHTGLITENSSSGSDWKYVIAGWNENLPKAKLTKISTDYYSLEITPSIIDFYSIPETETIHQMAFVFRSEDGSLVGRSNEGGDIFVNVYYPNADIVFTSPDSTNIFTEGDDVEINAVALFANEMQLYVNDTLFQTANSNQISYTYQATLPGKNTIKITATDGTDFIEDSISFFVRGETQIADLPSANFVDGINYIDDNTVTLVLYAPEKEFVFIKGSFNNWQLTLENQLLKTPDNNRYWITINNLNPGEEYIYQYIIDGEIIIADPYAEKVLDPWNDEYISNSTYPNLIDYPTGKATGIVSVFQTNQQTYNWEIEDFDRPKKEDLIIYELLIRDFIESHNYTTLIDTLDYLDSLGINAIELMPINEFEGNSSWGYNPSFYFAPDKYYGTKNQLKQFIDECHKRGIAVIMDIVLNHSYGQSPLVQMYFENGAPANNNPWYNRQSPNPVFSWGYDFNHQSQNTKEFVSRVVKFWLDEYKFDGYRFDFTKGFTNTPGDGSGYDASRISILKNIADTIWSAENDAYVILEHFADDSEEKVLTNYGMMVWGNHNHNYCQASMGYASESSFSRISYKNRGFSKPHLVGYMESHDEERQMFKNLSWGNSNGIYDIKELQTALKRAELTSLFFFTIPGPKMIWQFEELGYDYSIDYDCRVCEKPIRWDYQQEESRFRLYSFFKEIINLRNSQEVFTTNDFTMDVASSTKQITLYGSNMDMIILGNFDVVTKEITPIYEGNSTNFYECFTAEVVSDIHSSIEFQPGEFRLYTTSKLPKPNIPAFPKASNIGITGNLKVKETLRGSYTYFDMNGDEEGASTYQWYRADDSLGSNLETINNATEQTYTATKDDLNKFLYFEVTPKSNTESFSQGLPVLSGRKGPVFSNSTEPNVFPNPFVDGFVIENIEDFTQMTITNYLGRKVAEYNLSGEYGYNINLPQLRNGIYYLKLKSESKTKVIKVFKI